ncbi:MAG: type II secretion system F family protein [Pirellulales bacterium]|nr:type II secretion system F family protein [Pirellulales bacterium]
MPDFQYTARDTAGKKVVGQIAAATEPEAVRLLAGNSLFPLEISTDIKSTVRKSNKRVKGQVMAQVYGQLASLLRSGVPLLRSIKVLQKQATNDTLSFVLGEVYSQVEEGINIADAMAQYPKVFSEVCINMSRAGAEGGFLEDALDRVAKFTEQQEDLKGETIGQLAYPVFLGTVGSILVAGLVIFFVPKFGDMFDNLRERGELPAVTDWLLAFSESLRTVLAVVFAIVILVGLLVINNYFKTEAGRKSRDLIKIRLPLVGKVFLAFAVARFCRVLGTLLQNGVPILKSLEISSLAAGNRVISGAIDDATENITSGESLSKPLAQSGYFPGTVVEMISVAEESNTLDRVLIEIADNLEKRTARQLSLAVRLLEPIMLLVMAGAVLVVVIALLMPVIKMSSAI